MRKYKILVAASIIVFASISIFAFIPSVNANISGISSAKNRSAGSIITSISASLSPTAGHQISVCAYADSFGSTVSSYPTIGFSDSSSSSYTVIVTQTFKAGASDWVRQSCGITLNVNSGVTGISATWTNPSGTTNNNAGIMVEEYTGIGSVGNTTTYFSSNQGTTPVLVTLGTSHIPAMSVGFAFQSTGCPHPNYATASYNGGTDKTRNYYDADTWGFCFVYGDHANITSSSSLGKMSWSLSNLNPLFAVLGMELFSPIPPTVISKAAEPNPLTGNFDIKAVLNGHLNGTDGYYGVVYGFEYTLNSSAFTNNWTSVVVGTANAGASPLDFYLVINTTLNSTYYFKAWACGGFTLLQVTFCGLYQNITGQKAWGSELNFTTETVSAYTNLPYDIGPIFTLFMWAAVLITAVVLSWMFLGWSTRRRRSRGGFGGEGH